MDKHTQATTVSKRPKKSSQRRDQMPAALAAKIADLRAQVSRLIQQRDEARAKVGQLQLRYMELRRSILEVRQAVSCIGLALAAGNMRKAADLIENWGQHE